MHQIPNKNLAGFKSWPGGFQSQPCGLKSQPEVNIFKQRRSPCHSVQIFQLWPTKLVHSARTKVTFFWISLYLVSQYLSLWVYKSRHCMPRISPLCVLIKFEPTVPAGLQWKKKERKKNGLKIIWLSLERGLPWWLRG